MDMCIDMRTGTGICHAPPESSGSRRSQGVPPCPHPHTRHAVGDADARQVRDAMPRVAKDIAMTCLRDNVLNIERAVDIGFGHLCRVLEHQVPKLLNPAKLVKFAQSA